MENEIIKLNKEIVKLNKQNKQLIDTINQIDLNPYEFMNLFVYAIENNIEIVINHFKNDLYYRCHDNIIKELLKCSIKYDNVNLSKHI